MAILVSGGINSSQIKGKVGNNVFKRTNGQTLISAYQPIVKNPRTPAQRMVRAKFVEVTKGSRILYDRAFRKYGVKLKGHSAYTSILRMVFNNPVVKSVGYAGHFLPKYPSNNQKLIGTNTDLSNEIFDYLDIRWLRPTAQGEDRYYMCLSIPKGLFDYTPAGIPGKIYVGTNIPMKSLVFEVLLQGLYRATVKVPFDSFSINPRYGVDSYDTAFGASEKGIGGMYKYVVSFTDTLSLVTDPANSGNYLIGLHDPLTNESFGLGDVPAFECYWPGVKKAERIGAVVVMFSTPEDNANNLVGNRITPIYTRELLLAVNGVSSMYVAGA